jgi:hypothetical protein
MKILTLTVILGLPLLALGQQTTEPQQSQEQSKETQTTAPAKTKKMRPAQEQARPQAKSETNTQTAEKPTIRGRTQEMNKNEPGATRNEQPGTRSSTTTGTSQTNVGSTNQTTTVNKQEFRSRHSEVFSLGRHPKEFFVHRFGANHVRLIGNTYFAFVDGCWVAVDVDGFVYTQRMICAGDPDFIAVE